MAAKHLFGIVRAVMTASQFCISAVLVICACCYQQVVVAAMHILFGPVCVHDRKSYIPSVQAVCWPTHSLLCRYHRGRGCCLRGGHHPLPCCANVCHHQQQVPWVLALRHWLLRWIHTDQEWTVYHHMGLHWLWHSTESIQCTDWWVPQVIAVFQSNTGWSSHATGVRLATLVVKLSVATWQILAPAVTCCIICSAATIVLHLSSVQGLCIWC